MDDADPNGQAKEYAFRGKIMLIAVVILFIVIIIMLFLHAYVRWYLLRARRRQHLRRNRHSHRGGNLVFYVDPALTAASRGLDASVIASLPVFSFSAKTHRDPVECSVCLSEFEEGETGRVLPKCNHSFHIDCIDMWFQSHSTCPLCRAPVDPSPAGEAQPELAVIVSEPEPGTGSGLGSGEQTNRTEPAVSSSSTSVEKSSSFVSVTVRSESLGDESGCDSPSFRSSMSRILSLKRILSREKKPSSGGGMECSSTAELDVERGGREETQ